MATGWPMKVSYANGDVFSASDINDTNGTINLLGSSVAYTAGKNKIINGDFSVNQRSFTSTTVSATYGFDRWQLITGGTGGTTTYSTQSFTPGTAPVAGYEGANFLRLLTSSFTGQNTFVAVVNRMEDTRIFAGQTVTISFWAKAATGTPNVFTYLTQNFGIGGSPSAAVLTTPVAVKTITTSWARYSFNITLPSLNGKTIGTTPNTSFLNLTLAVSCGTDAGAPFSTIGIQNNTFDFWGVQVESGSTATAFQTATGTIQGELAACQRYYFRTGTGQSQTNMGTGSYFSATGGFSIFNLPVTMRILPTTLDYSSVQVYDYGAFRAVTNLILDANTSSATTAGLVFTIASGGIVYRPTQVQASTTSGYFGLSAEF